jgi:Fe-S cluster assembly iron-binding protein IscA
MRRGPKAAIETGKTVWHHHGWQYQLVVDPEGIGFNVDVSETSVAIRYFDGAAFSHQAEVSIDGDSLPHVLMALLEEPNDEMRFTIPHQGGWFYEVDVDPDADGFGTMSGGTVTIRYFDDKSDTQHNGEVMIDGESLPFLILALIDLLKEKRSPNNTPSRDALRQALAPAKQPRGTLDLSDLHKLVWNYQESLRKASADAARLANERMPSTPSPEEKT